MKKPDIYHYLNYRKYIKDMFCFLYEDKRYFSYRSFAMRAGFRSHSFVKHVMEGKRNLTSSSIAKISEGLSLNKGERNFFENLVLMNQADSHEEKDRYYKRIMSKNGFTRTNQISKEQYAYLSTWYYPVIREIIAFGDGRHTSEQIASMLQPKIANRQVQKALELLLDLGFIKKNGDGTWRQCKKDLTTGSEVKSIIIANYHKEMIKLASESIDRHPAKDRDLNALTVRINRNSIPEIKEKIAQFKSELIALEGTEEAPDMVMQINIQAFPVAAKTNPP